MLTAVLGAGLVRADFDWSLTYERSGGRETGRYTEALEFCKHLGLEANVQVHEIGKSPEGRQMVVVVVSTDSNVLDPAKRKKPLLYLNNGIHSGEIEGKDADLILARRLVKPDGAPDEPNWSGLLDKVSLAFVPVFSVDAHERMSPYNRINQNGPVEMGWRVTGQNFNLNRDWVKADAVEMQNLLGFMNKVEADFYVDNHTTDGGDWQYMVQWDVPNGPNLAPSVASISKKFIDEVMPKIDARGFLTAPYFGGFDQKNPGRGLSIDSFGPRYSTGYWSMRNRPSMLVETHVLKPYKDRVEATLAANELTLRFMADHADELLKANRAADAVTKAMKEGDDLVLSVRNSGKTRPFTFKGLKFEPYKSEVSGGDIPHWTREKVDYETVIRDQFEPGLTIKAPAGWLVPVYLVDVVDRLRLHGIEMVEIGSQKIDLTAKKFDSVTFGTEPFEGHFMPRFKLLDVKRTVDVPAGSYFVPVGQRLGRLAAQLLEPAAGDSFAAWGFFNGYLEQKEYGEAYAVEPMAKKMLEDPEVKAAFDEALKDPAFAGNPGARLDWFYARSPWFDQRYKVYPVYALSGAEAEGLKKR